MIGRKLPRSGCIRFRCCGSRNSWIPLTIMNACLLVCSCSVLCALPLAFLARSSRPPPSVLGSRSPRVTRQPNMFPALSVQVCFSRLSPCKNGHPEIEPRNLRGRTENERSRSPLSIGALRFAAIARGGRKRVVTKFASQPLRAALSRAWSRMTGVENSLKS